MRRKAPVYFVLDSDYYNLVWCETIFESLVNFRDMKNRKNVEYEIIKKKLTVKGD